MFFTPYYTIFVYVIGVNSSINKNLQTSQPGHIVLDSTNPTPIKRGRGRPRKNPLVSDVSPNLSAPATLFPMETLRVTRGSPLKIVTVTGKLCIL